MRCRPVAACLRPLPPATVRHASGVTESFLRCRDGIEKNLKPVSFLKLPKHRWRDSVVGQEPPIEGDSGAETGAEGNLFDAERGGPQQAGGVFDLLPAEVVVDGAGAAEDLGGEPADVLRGQVERLC